MKGLLKSKSAVSQFILFVSIALVSFFVLGTAGGLLLAGITKVSLAEMSDPSKMDFSKPAVLTFLRGMQVVQFIALFVVPVFICARLFSTNSKKYLGFKKPSNNLYFVIAVAAMVIAIPFVTYIGELNRSIVFPKNIADWMRKGEEEAAVTAKGLLSKHTIKDLILNLICIAGLAGIGEELFFRGMLQRLLIKMFRSPWAGIIVAAILFSAMHMQFYGFIPRLALGILLGAMYWYSGSLWVAIVAHFIYDALLVTMVYFNPAMVDNDKAGEAQNLALIGSVSFVCVVFLIEWMRKKTTATYNAVYAEDGNVIKDNPFDFE